MTEQLDLADRPRQPGFTNVTTHRIMLWPNVGEPGERLYGDPIWLAPGEAFHQPIAGFVIDYGRVPAR